MLVNNLVLNYLVIHYVNISLILYNHEEESNKSFLNKESEALKIYCFRENFPSNVNHHTVNICTARNTYNFSMCPNFVVQPLPKHSKYFRPDYDHVRYLAAQITTCGSLKRCTGCALDKTRNPTNFKILKEPLLVQKQTLHQQKALDLSYLEPEGHGRGIIMRA